MALDEIVDAIGIKPYNRTECGVLYCADCLDILPKIPDKSIDLVLTDPPYYRICGGFDFKWDNFDDYLADVKRWGEAVKSILSESGTLFWFGDDKQIAYSQVVLDKYFGLLNNLVWWKYNLRGGTYGTAGGDSVRSFPICTERILMYANDENTYECLCDGIRGDVFDPLRLYLNEERERAGLSITQISKEWKQLTGTKGEMAGHWFGRSQWVLPTAKNYEWLRGLFNNSNGDGEYLRREYEDLRREYEDLRREYEDLRRPFNNNLNLTEVLQFNGVTGNKTNSHETVKPLPLISALVSTCSRTSDIILDPFAGSGTTLVAAKQLGRKYIGIEINEDYCKICVERLRQEELF